MGEVVAEDSLRLGVTFKHKKKLLKYIDYARFREMCGLRNISVSQSKLRKSKVSKDQLHVIS